MNLAAASALTQLAMGGKGSGRETITKKHKIVAHPALHKMLSYQGFKIQSTRPGQSSYVHPVTGAKATVHDDGNWAVTYPKPQESKAKVKKMAAGGPGSGRHPQFGSLKESYPKTFKHLLERSHEARLNTGDPAGEYGTYHSISALPPSKQQAELEHSLVHHVATSMGPDMAYNRTGRMTSQVRSKVPGGNIVQAFEKGTLSKYVEPLAVGRHSDKYRNDADKYY